MRQMAGVLVKAPHLHQRPDRNIESALAFLAVLDAIAQQLEKLAAHSHRFIGGALVHPAQLTVGPVIRKHPIEPLASSKAASEAACIAPVSRP